MEIWWLCPNSCYSVCACIFEIINFKRFLVEGPNVHLIHIRYCLHILYIYCTYFTPIVSYTCIHLHAHIYLDGLSANAGWCCFLCISWRKCPSWGHHLCSPLKSQVHYRLVNKDIYKLITVYHTPHITGLHNPLHTPTNQGFAHCSGVFEYWKALQHWMAVHSLQLPHCKPYNFSMLFTEMVFWPTFALFVS